MAPQAAQGDGHPLRAAPSLGRATKTVPKGILPPVRAIVRDRQLVPIASVHTHRRAYTLAAEDSRVLVQVCDDEVLAERLPGPGVAQAWREWEIELVDGDLRVLDAIAERLLAAGATSPTVSSKLDRTLGDALHLEDASAPPRKWPAAAPVR